MEIVGGMVYGLDRTVDRLPPDPALREPRAAMEATIRAALGRPPCVVSFSGGRDSTSLLALAVAVARRDGYPVPIPVTLHFGEDGEANEDMWQQPIIERLGLPDWVRLDARQINFDAIGSVAGQFMIDHGLRWPFNAHFHIPVVEVAAGGSLITGFGGDELAMSSATALAEQAVHRTRPLRKSDVLSTGLALAPRVVRSRVHRRRTSRDLRGYHWLTPIAQRRLAKDWATDSARLPYGWPRVMDTLWRGRYFTLCRDTFRLMGSEQRVEVHHPFVDPDVLAAFAVSGPKAGYGHRTALLEALFGDVLPPEAARRSDKAGFTNPLWTDEARAFAEAWTGPNLHPELVDAANLRDTWTTRPGDARVTLLLQEAWLQDQGLLPGPT